MLNSISKVVRCGFCSSSMAFSESGFESRLYTPGPVQVSDSVRLATSRKTLGSREPEFVDYTISAREKLMELADISDDYTVVLLQGSGTYGVESAIQTVFPDDGRMLCISNGSFGERMAKIGSVNAAPENFKHVQMDYEEPLDIQRVGEEIESFQPTHLCCVHSETSTGTINDIESIGKTYCSGNDDLMFLVDGVSSFGGVDFNIEDCGIDFLMTSPNKCLESLSGVAIVFAKREHLLINNNYSRTICLDLIHQHDFLEECSMFRFTPPLECVVALEQACRDLQEETIERRIERYVQNCEYVQDEMERIGFSAYLSKRENRGHIVLLYDYPEVESFDFYDFYSQLVEAGCRIYHFPGQRLDRGVIRIGTIGDNDVSNFEVLINNIERISKERGYF